MANVTIANVTNALQKVIMPFIQDNFDKKTILLDQLKRNKGVTFMNDNFYAPIRTSRHGGVTALATDASSLITSNASIGQASVGVKYLTGTFTISKPVMDATKTTKGAVENQLTFQARSLADDFAKDVNRQLFGDGSGIISQVLGSVGEGTASLTYKNASLDDGSSIDNYGSINGDISPVKYVFPGMVLGFGTAAADLGTVASVTGTSVVVTGAPAIAANDAVFKMDGSGLGAGSAELTGVRAALSSSTGASTYAGVARSTTGWTPQIGTTAEALTLSAMEDVYLAAREYSQSGDRYAIFVNKTLYKKYGDILTSMRRTVNQTQLLGGWSGLAFEAGGGNVGVFLDYDVPDGEVLILNLDSFQMCQISDMGWSEDPSGALLRTRGNLLYEATMHWFMNLICVAPAANGRLTQKTA